MSLRTVFILVLVAFSLLCGGLVYESGFFQTMSAVEEPAEPLAPSSSGRGCLLLQKTADIQTGSPSDASVPASQQIEAASEEYFSATGGPERRITVGSVDPNTGFKYQLVLDSQGAAIRTATFSGFDNRDHKDPQPLVFLSPVTLGGGREVLSMANGDLVLVDQQRKLNLSRLSWKTTRQTTAGDGGTITSFEATVVDSQDAPVLKLTKTYRVQPDTYLLKCTLDIENVTAEEQKVRYNLTGPTGLGREAFRMDMRKVVAAFKSLKPAARDEELPVTSARLATKDLKKAQTREERELSAKNGGGLLWVASVNKYFAAILRPVPDPNKDYADWVVGKAGAFYNPDGDMKAASGDETVGLNLAIAMTELAPTGQAGSSRTYNFQLYIGPKDKSLFDKDELYRRLRFAETIDFLACCCPSSIINPLAFGILAIMKAMYGSIGNYGIVIIILVFLMRLIMHPITKKSQVSMSKMSKLAPRAEEIKKKYGSNKAEMNKRLMELYREQGASPIMGLLPMFVQMPIWIALWSAVYTSIDLRGAAFLPFWITDLSVPDALIRFRAVTLPLFGKLDSFNLLPILMGVAFYLQQKLMPSQAGAATNPQMAQQQKMMQIMLPLMFPLFLYKAPSGVNLYIMSSTFAGVIEQYVIRKHIREKEEQESKGLVAATRKTGGKVKKKKPKPFYKY